ncbi:MAG: hypothetical protein ACXU89_15465 [Xanthobacteraceae bacterium]
MNLRNQFDPNCDSAIRLEAVVVAERISGWSVSVNSVTFLRARCSIRVHLGATKVSPCCQAERRTPIKDSPEPSVTRKMLFAGRAIAPRPRPRGEPLHRRHVGRRERNTRTVEAFRFRLRSIAAAHVPSRSGSPSA